MRRPSNYFGSVLGVFGGMVSPYYLSRSWHLRHCPKHGKVAHLPGNICVMCLSEQSALPAPTPKAPVKPEPQVLRMSVVK